MGNSGTSLSGSSSSAARWCSKFYWKCDPTTSAVNTVATNSTRCSQYFCRRGAARIGGTGGRYSTGDGGRAGEGSDIGTGLIVRHIVWAAPDAHHWRGRSSLPQTQNRGPGTSSPNRSTAVLSPA